MILSEEELVYNYMIGNEEALSFLFSLYEKKVGPFLNKHDYVFKIIGYDYEDKKSFVRKCVLNTLKTYNFKYGTFNAYYSTIAIRELSNLYRGVKGSFEEMTINNTVSINELEISDRVGGNMDNSKEIELKLILEKIKSFGEIDYKIISLYLEGNTYNQIAEILKIKPKSVSNYLQKIRFKLKKGDY